MRVCSCNWMVPYLGKAQVSVVYEIWTTMPVQTDSLPSVTNHQSQHKVECWIYYIDSLGKFDYGPVARTL